MSIPHTNLNRDILSPQNELLAAVVESSDDAILAKTLDGVITSWYLAAERIYGWSSDEAIGRHVSFLVPPDKTAELAVIMNRVHAGEQVGNFETVRLHRDGQRIDIALTMSPVWAADGRIVGIYKTARDIRARKQGELALRKSEERYRELIESIPALVWVYDFTGQQVLHNRRWYEYTGQSPDNAMTDRWTEALHPDDASRAIELWEQCKANGEPYDCEYRLRRTDGVYRWFLSKKTAVKGPEGITQWIGFCTDIDDRKQAEQKYHRSAELLRVVIDGTTDAVFVKDLDGKYLLFNEAASQLTGKPASEVLGQDDTAIFDTASARVAMDNDRLVMASGVTETKEEELTSSGATRIYLATKAPYRDGTGKVIGVVGTSRNVTERFRLAAERDRLLARMQLQIARMPLAYILFDADFVITEWNPAAERIFGYTRAEALGLKPIDLAPPSFQNETREILNKIRAVNMDAHSKNENQTKDGRLITCEWFLQLRSRRRDNPLQGPPACHQGPAMTPAQDAFQARDAPVDLRQFPELDLTSPAAQELQAAAGAYLAGAPMDELVAISNDLRTSSLLFVAVVDET